MAGHPSNVPGGGRILGQPTYVPPAQPADSFAEKQLELNMMIWDQLKTLVPAIVQMTENSNESLDIMRRTSAGLAAAQMPHLPVVGKVTGPDGEDIGWSWYCLACSYNKPPQFCEFDNDPERWPPGLLVIAPQMREPGGP